MLALHAVGGLVFSGTIKYRFIVNHLKLLITPKKVGAGWARTQVGIPTALHTRPCKHDTRHSFF